MSALYDEKQNICGGDTEQSIRRLNKKLDVLDNLTDELALLWENAVEGNCDENKIDEILAEMDTVEPVAKPFDVSAGLAGFHRDYEELFEKTETLPRPQTDKKQTKKTHSVLRRVFPVAAVFAIVFGGMVSAQALGLDVFGSIARWTDEVFSFEANDAFVPAAIHNRPYTAEENISFQSVQDIIDSFEISGEIVPNWLPEEFSDTSVMTSYTVYIRPDNGVEINAFYWAEDRMLTINYIESDNPSTDAVIIEKENYEPILYSKEQIDYYIISDLELSKIVWINGCFECSIFGQFTPDEAIQIIDSIHV